MRLNNYLNEELEKTYNKIKKECSTIIDFYKAWTGREHFFWRGSHKHWSWDKITPRTDRQPKDLPQQLHDELNWDFNQKFGWKVRSEGVFVTSSREQARTYGKPYIFFPANGFKYVFNPKITDLYVDLIAMGILRNDQVEEFTWYFHKEDIVNGYKSNQLAEAFRNSVEVAFKCKYYYLIHETFAGDLLGD